MTLSLPESISTYFNLCNSSDIDQVASCFMLNAIVVDEGQTYRGHDAIQSWQLEAQKKFEYTVEPVSMAQDGNRLTVTANVVGNFSGSPVKLDHVFELADDKIKSLEIN